MKTVGNCRNPRFLSGGRNQADSSSTKHKTDVEKAKMAISSVIENHNRREFEGGKEPTRPPSIPKDITLVLWMCILGVPGAGTVLDSYSRITNWRDWQDNNDRQGWPPQLHCCGGGYADIAPEGSTTEENKNILK
ncbi:hypothetical protein SLA2020_341570 [Shorea laevis]